MRCRPAPGHGSRGAQCRIPARPADCSRPPSVVSSTFIRPPPPCNPRPETPAMRSSLRLLPLEDRLTPALDVLAVTAPNNGPPAVTEYAPDGSVVRVLTPPPTDDNRDVAVSPNGDIQLFNGTFSPELSTYHAGAWSNQTVANWSTVNNLTYGG